MEVRHGVKRAGIRVPAQNRPPGSICLLMLFNDSEISFSMYVWSGNI